MKNGRAHGFGEALRSRFWCKALDAVLTAELRPRQGVGRLLGTLVSPSSSHFDRTAALRNLLSAAAPGLVARAHRRLLLPGVLPFRGVELELMAYGSGATVFLVHATGRRYVLKVNRRSLGRSRASLAELGRTVRGKYESARRWFGEGAAGDVLVPTSHLILAGPLRGFSAVATVQPFIEGAKSDFFRDHSDDEILDLLGGDARLRQSFLAFGSRFLEVYRSQGRCVDLLGRENLMLVRNDGRYRLRLVDYGVFDLALQGARPDLIEGMASLGGRLQGLIERVASNPRRGER